MLNTRRRVLALVACLAASVACLAAEPACDDAATLSRNRAAATATLDHLAGSTARREQAIERAWGDRSGARGWSKVRARDVLVSVYFGQEYKAFEARQAPLRKTLYELRDFGKAQATEPPAGCDFRDRIEALARRLGEMEDEQQRWALRKLEVSE